MPLEQHTSGPSRTAAYLCPYLCLDLPAVESDMVSMESSSWTQALLVADGMARECMRRTVQHPHQSQTERLGPSDSLAACRYQLREARRIQSAQAVSVYSSSYLASAMPSYNSPAISLSYLPTIVACLSLADIESRPSQLFLHSMFASDEVRDCISSWDDQELIIRPNWRFMVANNLDHTKPSLEVIVACAIGRRIYGMVQSWR